MSNFWKKLNKPFFVLAPMENVTDFVFREIVATQLPSPDVYFTEFTNTDGLTSKGFEAVIHRFKYSMNQHPIVAQIWGTNPEAFYKSAKIIKDMKFDGIDINMACPVPAVMKKGAGSALIHNQSLVNEIINATREGANNLPVSVKTRLGIKTIETDNWIKFLLEQKVDALTIHGRTAKQMSTGQANWEEIGNAVKIKNKISPDTIIIGNGDVRSYQDGVEKYERYKVDGIMIGRGIFSNPWIFDKDSSVEHSPNEYIDVLFKHLDLFQKTYGNTRNFAVMKKYFKMYVNNFRGANELRVKLMEKNNYQEVKIMLNKLPISKQTSK